MSKVILKIQKLKQRPFYRVSAKYSCRGKNEAWHVLASQVSRQNQAGQVGNALWKGPNPNEYAVMAKRCHHGQNWASHACNQKKKTRLFGQAESGSQSVSCDNRKNARRKSASAIVQCLSGGRDGRRYRESKSSIDEKSSHQVQLF